MSNAPAEGSFRGMRARLSALKASGTAPSSPASACVVRDKQELLDLVKSGNAKGVNQITLRVEGYKRFDNNDLAMLAKHFPKLQHLRLDSGDGKITDDGLAHLRHLPLRSLDLRGCDVSDAGVAQVAGKTLQQLSLENCTRVTGQIVQSLQHSGVKELNLAGTGLGRITPDFVQGVAKMPALERLDLRDAYSECDETTMNLLRARLGEGLKSDGIKGRTGAVLEDWGRPILRQLLDEGKIRDAHYHSWAQRQFGMEPERTAMERLTTRLMEPFVESAGEVLAEEMAQVTHSEEWERLQNLPSRVAQDLAAHFMDNLEKTPQGRLISALMGAPAQVADAPAAGTARVSATASLATASSEGVPARPTTPTQPPAPEPVLKMPGAWVED